MNRVVCHGIHLAIATTAVLFAGAPLAADDTAAEQQTAFVEAVARVAPAVVQIETVGGREQVDGMLLGVGPTTGLVVDPAGYVISSTFNFIGKPTSIIVRLADGSRKPARLVATDHARMLVLLKIDAEGLPVCEIAPRSQMRVGQWAIAVGRAFASDKPNMAVGILSALDRVWGRAIQTDAAVSPNNYGGPLIDIHGRVLGILAPLSPQGGRELAGVELYDSGIGFAVPAEDMLRVLPRLKKGEDLYPGVAGVSLPATNPYTATTVVAAVRAKSPAALAGIKPRDVIVELGGQTVARNIQVRDELGRHYAGDKLSVTVLRNGHEIKLELVLAAKLEPFQHGFLGILPMRGDAEKGVAVRYVYPDSPAASAGIAVGDVIVSLAGKPITDRIELVQEIGVSEPGSEITLGVRRGDALRTFKATLAATPDTLPPDTLPPAQAPSAPQQAKDDAPKAAELPRRGPMPLKIPEFDNKAWAYVPNTYRPDATYGIVVWLQAPGHFDWKELLARWQPLCDQYDLILVAPQSSDAARWAPGEAALVDRLLVQVATNYHVDPMRVVVHGYRGGGAMAFLAAFRNRQAIRAVAAVEAVPVGVVPENDPLLRFSVYLASASASPNARAIQPTIETLQQRKIPLATRDLGATPRYLDPGEVSQLVRWIDMLDRI